MIPTTLAAVAEVVGGRVVSAPGSTPVSGRAVLDSRVAGAGDLFVALPGERADGHDHAAAAVAAGASGALLAREVPGVPGVVVPDVADALRALASAERGRLAADVVGVTGSAGKTTTKDLLAAVLAGRGPLVAPPGSWNNELGVPLTVLAADAGTRSLVLEMGARGPGHVRWLCDVGRPDVGVVLMVGRSHLGEFGSVEAIAQAKGELAEAAGRAVVLNADDARVRAMASRATVPVTLVGTAADGDVRAVDVDTDDEARAVFRLVAPDGEAPVHLRLVGEHHVGNALAAAGVASVLGVGVAEVAERLSAARAASRWRMEVQDRADGLRVVNDAYNASPESVRAALKALARTGRASGRRTVAVLGVMKELGEDSRAEHMDVGRFAVRLDLGRLVVVGPEAGGIYAGAVLEGSWGSETVHVPDVGAALEFLADDLRADDVVLVKASRAAGLERVAESLLAGAG